MRGIPKVLAVGGSDPGGGAGIQADLKVMAQFGVYGAAAITSLTRQTSRGVFGVLPLATDWVIGQVEDVLWDLRPRAIKTGMLQNEDNIRGLARLWRRYVEDCRRFRPGETVTAQRRVDDIKAEHREAGHEAGLPVLVVDPVLTSGTGVSLMASGGIEALSEELLPGATVVTPNIPEAEAITGLSIRSTGDMEKAADSILALGVQWVLLKGGHLPVRQEAEIADLLCGRGKRIWLKGSRVVGPNLHGTGCTLASALASLLARGLPVEEAVNRATRWVRRGIACPLTVGKGMGVVCQTRSALRRQHSDPDGHVTWVTP